MRTLFSSSLRASDRWSAAKRAAIDLPARWSHSPLGFGALLVFAAAFLSAQFDAGYGGDDLLNASTPGLLRNCGLSFAKYLTLNINDSMATGRFFPVALLLTYGLHELIPNAKLFHLVVLALLLADLTLYYRLLRLWRIERPLARLNVLFLVLLFQFRSFYDPILHYAGLLPLLVGEILLALVAFECYLASGRVRSLVASLLAYSLALTTYEIAFMVAPIFLLMSHARERDWRKALSAVHGHATVALMLAAFTVGLRYQARWHANSAYAPRFHLTAILETTALQTSAALPLSYALLSKHSLENLRELQTIGAWQNWAICAAAGILSWGYLRQTPRAALTTEVSSWKLPALAGAAIWILPGALIALSPKYQREVCLGLGYLPVFLQYFGFALVALAALLWARGRWPRHWPKLIWGVALCNAALAMITFDSNRAVTAKLSAAPIQRELRLIESACRTGLYDSMPEGAMISSAQRHDWMLGIPEFGGAHFSKQLGRVVFAAVGRPNLVWIDPARHAEADSIPTFAMNDRQSAGGSYVVLGPVEPAVNNETATNAALKEDYHIRRFRLFLSGDYAARSRRRGELTIAVHRVASDGCPTMFVESGCDLAELEVATGGDEGLVLTGAFARPVAISAVSVLESPDFTEWRVDAERLAHR